MSPGESETKFMKVRTVGKRRLPGNRSGLSGTSCRCPLLPWLEVSLGPLELRIEEVKYTLEDRGSECVLKEHVLGGLLCVCMYVLAVVIFLLFCF